MMSKCCGLSLQKAGFESVKRFPLQQSDSACLRSLENEHRMPGGFLSLESLTLEGVKGRRANYHNKTMGTWSGAVRSPTAGCRSCDVDGNELQSKESLTILLLDR